MRFWNVSTVLCVAAAGCIVTPPNFNDRGHPVDTGTFVEGTGVVEFAWQVGATGCEAAGVEQIEVSIGTASRTFACGSGRGSMQVDAGTWDLVAFGLDLDGVARYEGFVAGVQVFDGQTRQIGTIRLQARTGQVEATWRFQNGELCGPNGVQELDIALLKANRIEAQLFTECNDGIELIDRVVSGEYEISVLANDAYGFALFGADASLVVLEGERTRVDLVLVEN